MFVSPFDTGFDSSAHDDIPSVFNECIIVNPLTDKLDTSHPEVKSPMCSCAEAARDAFDQESAWPFCSHVDCGILSRIFYVRECTELWPLRSD